MKKAHKRHKQNILLQHVKNNHIKKSIQIKNVIDDIRKLCVYIFCIYIYFEAALMLLSQTKLYSLDYYKSQNHGKIGVHIPSYIFIYIYFSAST